MKIISRVRRLRLELQAKEGRQISIQDIANATGIGRVRLNNIELGKIEQISTEELDKLCSFYSQHLERLIDTNSILGYDPNKEPAPMRRELRPIAA